ncbi:MAG: hypothetical protein JWO08_2749 [Verrucomicrobiaceae bacterium]|nr:hypothetical protein [Verrucomicrobiaceae bacterium]
MVLAAGRSQGQSVEPFELPRLRTSYEGAVQRAVKPLQEAYRNELLKLRDSYTKAGRLNEAVAIAAELDVINAKLGLPPARPVDAAMPVKTVALAGAEVKISANDANGFDLGPVNRGDVIILQYVAGLWKSHGILATANPDDPKEGGGDINRLVIAVAAEKGMPGKVIKIVPPSTMGKPFKFTFPTSRPGAVLRINENSNNPNNPGAVIYKVTMVH